MSHFDLNQITIFVTVVEQKGVRAAAEKLGMAQSSVSRAIVALEARLGTRLFERSARAFRVTEEGLHYYGSCRVAIDGLAEADALLRNRRQELSGTLRISAPVVLGKYLLNDVVASFLASHPKAHLNLEVTDRIADMVPEGVDLCIRLGSTTADPHLVSFVLARPHAGLYASASYLREHGVPGTPDDIAGHLTLSLGPLGRKAQWTLQNGEKIAVLALKPMLQTNDMPTLLNAAMEGRGICLAPHFVCLHERLPESLLRVLPEWEHEAVDVRALYPSRKSMTPLLRAFIDLLVVRASTVLNAKPR